MTNIVFTHPMLVQGRQNSVKGGVFEAELNDIPCNAETNADLTLYMRVHMQDGFYDSEITEKIDSKKGIAKDADHVGFHVTPWKPEDFVAWKSKLLRQARAFWNGHFWLMTPNSYSGLDWPPNKPTHRPNVWCRLELSESLTKNGAHYSISCVNIGDSVDPNYQYAFRSHMFLYKSNASLHTKSHEVGHLLGLDHPSGNINTKAAYADKPGHPGDIMGSGLKRYCHHALPWQKAIALVTETKVNDWKVFMHRVPPHPLHKHHH